MRYQKGTLHTVMSKKEKRQNSKSFSVSLQKMHLEDVLDCLTYLQRCRGEVNCFASNMLCCWYVIYSVGSEPKLGSAWLGFGSSSWEKKLGSARLAMPSKKLGSARLAISCKKSSVQLGLLYDLKNRVTLKTKNELIFNIFATFLRYNLEDINKSVFFLLKSCIL